MTDPAAVVAALKRAKARNEVRKQIGSELSPLVAQYQQWIAGQSTGQSLPRDPAEFLQAVFAPLAPIGVMGVNPPPEDSDLERGEPRIREMPPGWNMPVGVPGSEGFKLASFGTLRMYADLYSVARACLQTRKSEIRGLTWDIMPTSEAEKKMRGDKSAHQDFADRRKTVVQFFKRPDPEYFQFGSYIDAVVEEMLAVDALSLYLHPTRKKGAGPFGSSVASLEIISGHTIRPMVNTRGARPTFPNVAYQQYLYGVPRVDLATMVLQEDVKDLGQPVEQYRGDQLLYLPYTQRSWTPYGFPPLERALIPIVSGLRKQQYQMDFFDEGTIPGNFISPGENVGWTPNQLEIWQNQMNALAGDPAWKHKTLALPPGSRVFPMRPAQLADQFDEIVMTQVCMAYDIMPMELGISPRVSTTQSPGAANQMAKASQDTNERKSLKPTLAFLSDIFNLVIQEIFGQDDMRFVFEGLEEDEDENSLIDRLVKMVSTGFSSIDEARIALGKPPWGLPITGDPGILSATGGFVPLGSINPITGKPMGVAPPPAAGALPPGGGGPGEPPGAPGAPGGQPPGSAPPGGPAKPGEANGKPDAAGPAPKPGEPGSPESEAHRKVREAFDAGKPMEPPVRPPIAGTEADQASAKSDGPPVTAMLSELDMMRRHANKGRDVATWDARYLPDLMVDHYKSLLPYLSADDAHAITHEFIVSCFGPPVLQGKAFDPTEARVGAGSTTGGQFGTNVGETTQGQAQRYAAYNAIGQAHGTKPTPTPASGPSPHDSQGSQEKAHDRQRLHEIRSEIHSLEQQIAGLKRAQATAHRKAGAAKTPTGAKKPPTKKPTKTGKPGTAKKPSTSGASQIVSLENRVADLRKEARGIERDLQSNKMAGGADPKAPTPGETTRDWPGWRYDDELVSLYSTQLYQAIRDAVDPAELVGTWLRSRSPQISKAAPAPPPAGASDAWSWLVARGYWQKLVNAIQRILNNLWTEGFAVGREAAQEMLGDFDRAFWDAWQPGDPEAARLVAGDGLQALLDDYGIATIKAIADTRIQQLADYLAVGADQGWSAGQIEESIKPILDNPGRAEMIADTELARATSQASVQAYQEAGREWLKWSVTPDKRLCPKCLEAKEGGPVHIGQPFPGTGTIATPGHPRCRCATLPARAPADAGLITKSVDIQPGSAPPITAPEEQGKVSPISVNYRWSGGDRTCCASCTMFTAPHRCSLVGGGVKPWAICDEYDPLGHGVEQSVRTEAIVKVGPHGYEHGWIKVGVGDSGYGSFQHPVEDDIQADFGHLTKESDQAYAADPRYYLDSYKVGNLIPTQYREEHVVGERAGDQGTGKPFVVIRGNKEYLIDGHHRADNAGPNGRIQAWTLVTTHTKISKSADLTAGGIAVRAANTGRVLMIQRAHDEDDPAGGYWEFPGGRMEDGESALSAAQREWAEETGLDLPDGDMTGTWRQGPYQGFVLSVPSEDVAPILDREKGANPDDPDNDKPEALAWWDPAELKDNPAVRPEIQKHPKRVRRALESAGGKVGKGILSDLATALDVDAQQVYDQLSENYPPDSIAWVLRATWRGPYLVPWDDIDHDDMDKWAASHQPGKVGHFSHQIESGDEPHPVVLVADPDGNFIDVDGHHRALAYHRLGRPVRAWIGRINPADRHAMEETHLDQEHEGGDPLNKQWGVTITKVGPHGYEHGWHFVGAEGPDDSERHVYDDLGHRHWGAYGAAGLLIHHTDQQGTTRYLLQHRSPHVQLGNTWSTPGGALHRDEHPIQGAIREAAEEFGGRSMHTLEHTGTITDDHGGWAYHTVMMRAPHRFRPGGQAETAWESQGYRWVTADEVNNLNLHPGFAASFPSARNAIESRTATKAGPKGYIHGWIEVDGATGTHEMHAGPHDGYTAERKALHDSIVENVLAGHQPQSRPVATFMGGGPGSGKSTLLGSVGDPGAVIDADSFKSQLPEYKRIVGAGGKNAASFTYLEGADMAKDAVTKATDRGINFTLDGAGSGGYDSMKERIDNARRGGHHIHAVYVTTSTEEAIRRAQQRGRETGRWVPEPVIRAVHQSVTDTFRDGIDRNLFDSAELWDNNEPQPRLIGRKDKGGQWTVHDPALWQQFLAKGTTGG